jgi:aldehyde:ferredoxin oxidoreductase
LAWATEAQEKGIISNEDTMGLSYHWGDVDTYLKGIQNIVRQPNEFYKCLASGVDVASSRYGGSDYALAFGGNEMPGYHTGPVAHIGHLVGSRHSHLDGGGYSIDQGALKSGGLSEEEAVKKLLDEEAWRQILSSLVVCFFARGIYDPETVKRCLNVAGFHVEANELEWLGYEVLKEKNRFKVREGFDPLKLRIPSRVYETPSPRGDVTEEIIRSGVADFFKRLGA